MTIATAVGLFIIPVCYVFVQRIVEKSSKKKTDAPKPETEIAAGAAPLGGAH